MTKTATMNIGNIVKAAREALKISTADLARVSGMRRPSIEAIEKGRATTAKERHDLAATIAWIASHGVSA